MLSLRNCYQGFTKPKLYQIFYDTHSRYFPIVLLRKFTLSCLLKLVVKFHIIQNLFKFGFTINSKINKFNFEAILDSESLISPKIWKQIGRFKYAFMNNSIFGHRGECPFHFGGEGVMILLITTQNLRFLLFPSLAIKMFISGVRWNYII